MEIAELILNYVEVLVWPALVLTVLARYRRHIGDLIARTRTVDTPAGSIQFTEQAREMLDEAAAQNDVPTPRGKRRGVVRRLEHAAQFLSGARVLWVDDHPENNSSLIRLFRSAGMDVETVLSTDDAVVELRSHSYDVVLTDMRRGDDTDAGNVLLRELTRLGVDVPAVVFSSRVHIARGIDGRAFAATNNADDVVHYVIDVMERARFA